MCVQRAAYSFLLFDTNIHKLFFCIIFYVHELRELQQGKLSLTWHRYKCIGISTILDR
jgi:hypothetical protein